MIKSVLKKSKQYFIEKIIGHIKNQKSCNDFEEKEAQIFN